MGYSAYNHRALTIWEGQFGDFCNTCQVISKPDESQFKNQYNIIVTNTIQVTLDCILSSGESKWGRQVGLVLFLPHGMEGQGPEHSSARFERFLQMCDDDCNHVPGTEPNAAKNKSPEEIMTRQLFETNLIVCNMTTPANFFHVLRRQILMPFRKPLVNDFTSKILTRQIYNRSFICKR